MKSFGFYVSPEQRRRAIADAVVGAGAILVSYGMYLIFPPMAFMADGVALVVLGVTLDSRVSGMVSRLRKAAESL